MPPQGEARSYLQELQKNTPALPFEPNLLPMLFAVTREDSAAPTKELVALVERSQKLASRVLAIANSAVYGLKYKVSTLHRAVSILGLQEIRTLVVMVGVSSVIKETKLPKAFDVNAWWKHQLKVAMTAKTLAALLGGPVGICGPSAEEEDRLRMDPDEAYVAGLLHDIGKAFFASSRPGLWESMEESWKSGQQQYFEVENACWGMDHALIGAAVLHHWRLPLVLTEAINWHHTPEVASTYKMEARLLAAANHMAHSQRTAGGGLCEAARALLPEGSAAALDSLVAAPIADLEHEAFVTLVE